MNQPWSVQIELTEGCNRLCTFCGLNGIRDKPGNYRYMTPALAEDLAWELADLAPDARYEFAMHGEPLKNPDHDTILRSFRAHLPRAQMQVTTNGIALLGHMKERVEALFVAGLDFIVLDTYRPERDKLRREVATLKGVTVRDFYDDMAPKGESPWHNLHRKMNRTIVLMDDLEARTGEVKSRVILNHAGNSPAREASREPLKKTCTLPFRELTVTWDGRVNLCCMDWKHQYSAGQAPRPLRDIWYGPEMEAARAKLQNRERDFGPCAKCDAGSGNRSGLLPKYPPVTTEQRQTVVRVEQASPRGSNAVFTKKRLRVVD
jgi:hypothetical protein